MVLALYYLQSYYRMEIFRGQNGLGNFHLHTQYKDVLQAQPFPTENTYSPEEIVERIKGNLHKESTPIPQPENDTPTCSKQLSQGERAQRVITEKRISFDHNLHTFTVLNSEDRPHAVKLFPKSTCTCPSTTECYHIPAAKIYIGMEDNNPRRKMNLTQLRKNNRSRREKKSGRKHPRPGDCDVEPAPDAAKGKQDTLGANADEEQGKLAHSIQGTYI